MDERNECKTETEVACGCSLVRGGERGGGGGVERGGEGVVVERGEGEAGGGEGVVGERECVCVCVCAFVGVDEEEDDDLSLSLISLSLLSLSPLYVKVGEEERGEEEGESSVWPRYRRLYSALYERV